MTKVKFQLPPLCGLLALLLSSGFPAAAQTSIGATRVAAPRAGTFAMGAVNHPIQPVAGLSFPVAGGLSLVGAASAPELKTAVEPAASLPAGLAATALAGAQTANAASPLAVETAVGAAIEGVSAPVQHLEELAKTPGVGANFDGGRSILKPLEVKFRVAGYYDNAYNGVDGYIDLKELNSRRFAKWLSRSAKPVKAEYRFAYVEKVKVDPSHIASQVAKEFFIGAALGVGGAVIGGALMAVMLAVGSVMFMNPLDIPLPFFLIIGGLATAGGAVVSAAHRWYSAVTLKRTFEGQGILHREGKSTYFTRTDVAEGDKVAVDLARFAKAPTPGVTKWKRALIGFGIGMGLFFSLSVLLGMPIAVGLITGSITGGMLAWSGWKFDLVLHEPGQFNGQWWSKTPAKPEGNKRNAAVY